MELKRLFGCSAVCTVNTTKLESSNNRHHLACETNGYDYLSLDPGETGWVMEVHAWYVYGGRNRKYYAVVVQDGVQ
jgi:hypothetical protein